MKRTLLLAALLIAALAAPVSAEAYSVNCRVRPYQASRPAVCLVRWAALR